MRAIEAEELWALLDGELPPERAAEIRAALDRDPVLRQSYQQLAACDAAWSARAAAARFRPRLRIDHAPRARRILTAAAVVFGLLLFRMAFKSLPPLQGAGLEALLLAFVVGWGLRRILHATDADRSSFQLSTDG